MRSAAPPGNSEPLDEQAQADLVFAWSTVHGFANLALDGQMPFVQEADLEEALEALAERVVRRRAMKRDDNFGS